MRRLLLAALPVLLFLSVSPAQAQALPGCSPSNANERVCQGGNICVCRITGGLLHGFPQAFRWDCGIHNGGCIPGTYRQMTPIAPGSGVAVLAPPSARSSSGGTVGTPAPGKAEIADAQAALAAKGFNPGPVDGVMGPRTRAALNAWLQRERLPPSDRITPEIYRRLVP
jgi:hypothetical protein